MSFQVDDNNIPKRKENNILKWSGQLIDQCEREWSLPSCLLSTDKIHDPDIYSSTSNMTSPWTKLLRYTQPFCEILKFCVLAVWNHSLVPCCTSLLHCLFVFHLTPSQIHIQDSGLSFKKLCMQKTKMQSQDCIQSHPYFCTYVLTWDVGPHSTTVTS